MQRRAFIIHLSLGLNAALLLACSSGPIVADADRATRRHNIDVAYQTTLERIRVAVPGLRPYIDKARGTLLFPTVVAGGLNSNDIYGEGVLHMANAVLSYYSVQSSARRPIGTPGKVFALLFLFMEQRALDEFLVSEIWRIGAGTPVTVWRGAEDDSGRLAAAPIISLPLGSMGIISGVDLQGMAVAPLEL